MEKLLDAVSEIKELYTVLVMSIIEGMKGEPVEYRDVVYSYDENHTVGLVLAQLFSATNCSVSTLLKISNFNDREMHGKDCLIISRGIIESCINCCYIMSAGEEVAQASIDHAISRGYRNTNKSVGKEGFSITAKNIPELTPTSTLSEILEKFTSKKNKPKNWTDLTVVQRIEQVYNVFGSNLATALSSSYLMVYGDASEVIHGSLAGAQIGNGTIAFRSHPLKDEEHLDIQRKHVESSLMSSFVAVSTVVEVFSKFSGNKELLILSERCLDLVIQHLNCKVGKPQTKKTKECFTTILPPNIRHQTKKKVKKP
jgi:hypothetical protein